jgi:hypothetical protein
MDKFEFGRDQACYVRILFNQVSSYYPTLVIYLFYFNIATPIFCVCWSAENDAILYCAGKHLVMKPLSPNSKQNSV